MEDLVSVIIPIYNAEKYLGQCIQSVIDQTYKTIEIILVDDGSNDNSLEVCNNYLAKDSRIRVISKQNEGEAATRNRGIEEAVGKFIVFVDNDDFISVDMIEKMITAIREKSSQCAICSFSYVNEVGERKHWAEPTLKFPACVSGIEACRIFLTSREIEGFAWNKMFEKNIYMKANAKYEGYPPDIVTSFIMLNNCESVAFVPDKLYFYRQVAESQVHVPSVKKVQMSKITTNKLVEIAKQCGFERESEQYRSYHDVYHMYDLVKEKDNCREEWLDYCNVYDKDNSGCVNAINNIKNILASNYSDRYKMILKVFLCLIMYK